MYGKQKQTLSSVQVNKLALLKMFFKNAKWFGNALKAEKQVVSIQYVYRSTFFKDHPKSLAEWSKCTPEDLGLLIRRWVNILSCFSAFLGIPKSLTIFKEFLKC